MSDARLAALADEPPETRAATLMALAWEPQDAPLAVEAFLADPSPLVRVAAAFARLRSGAPPRERDRLVEVIADVLCGDDEEHALAAGTALVELGELVTPILVRRCERTDAREPLIVRVLGELAGPDARACLQSLVEETRGSAAARAEARAALAALARESSA
ncbi:MAG: hypothetical protein KC636_26410 [Myxococcales bacterium]|nr:hypothetical protein [Myxococcales bacterium]